MISKEQLRKIAIYCQAYEPIESRFTQITSKLDDGKFRSCENCIHFTKEGRCDIDLIDKVLTSLAMEEDLKS